MSNIMDYLKWRGDLTFEKSPFNEVDNVILSELVYVDFADIIPEHGEITLDEACERFFERHEEKDILARKSMTKMAAFVMREMTKTDRFGSIRLMGYVNEINTDEECQFCAMTVMLGDGRICVVYRGTDETIVGWKEDFNMSFLQEIPGQKRALEYLRFAAGRTDLPLRVMGHSKGGNLAIYAAVSCEDAIQRRIEEVYCNDGPGFQKETIESEAYRRLDGRLHSIVPDTSIVGMMLEHEEAYEIIKSSGKRAGQHDLLSWEVEGKELVHLYEINEASVLLDQTLKAWIFQMEPAQREEFVNTLFGVLYEAQIQTVDDLANMKPAKVMEILKLGSKLDKKSQEILRDTLGRLFLESGRSLKDMIHKKTDKKTLANHSTI